MTTPGGGPDPVFIDFEGIDGSGKTTLSNRLADYLKKQGIQVHHARDRGIFRSEISRAIRDLTRDPRFLRMTDVTELLLYTARDAQMIEEFIRPKLLPGHVVFSDRYLYSTITHSHFGRGLERRAVDSVLNLAAGGIWPDLIIYCDVDPLTSRIRKKIQKVREHRLGDFGRKGLMGIGFREQMREGFLRLAEEDSENWLVIDNARSTIEESMQRIYQKVAVILQRKGYGTVPDPHWADTGRRAAAEKQAEATPESLRVRVKRLFDLFEEDRREAVVRLFFEELMQLATVQSGYSALFLVGLDHPEADQLRDLLIDKEPSLIAFGLRGLRSETAMQFRERLKNREPIYIARSASGMAMDPRAIALRLELARVAPEPVALSLRGNDTEEAWELREQLWKEAKNEVLVSLRGLDTERAWEFREKKIKEKHFPALLESLGGIDSEIAWAWRERLADEYLPWVLLSLRGLFSDRAWRWRKDHIHRAPKIIIKTIGRSEDLRAWELREHAKYLAKEVLDSISGLECGKAWNLRLALRDKWPNTTVSSLGAGNQSERAWNFRWEQVGRNPENLLLLKHIVKASIRAIMEEDEDEEESEDDLG